MLVEDNAINCLVAQGLLERLGLTADTASNGREALDILQRSPGDRPYTLILLDCLMPELDGYDTSRQIRAGEAGDRYRSIPIVAMTANAMQGDREKCLAAGMNDYLAKPIEPPLLAQTLQHWLNRLPAATPTASQQAASEPSVFDLDTLLARFSGYEDLAAQTCRFVLDDLPSQVAALQALLNEGNAAAVACQAHGIKGAAANIAGEALRAAALAVEQSAKAGELLSAQQHFEVLATELARLQAAIAAWLESSSP